MRSRSHAMSAIASSSLTAASSSSRDLPPRSSPIRHPIGSSFSCAVTRAIISRFDLMGLKFKAKLDSPAAKVMAVLDAVARLRAAPLHALAEQLDLPTPTAHRICRELERLGWLQRVPGSRMWTVARALVDLSANTLASVANAATAHAILRSLT